MAYFDIETNGLYRDVTAAHCMVIKIDDGNVILHYRHADGVHQGALKLLDVLQKGGTIVGHNIINYDIPVLEKLYPDFKVPREYRKQVMDTLVMCRLMYGDIGERDFGLIRTGRLPAKLRGSQTLKAWGYRLGTLKGTYGEETENAWAEFSEEMLKYNEQDVVVTEKLYKWLTEHNKSYPVPSLVLEHKAQWLMAQQERNGFTFDVLAAQQLEAELRGKVANLDAALRKVVPQVPDKIFVPKRDNKRLGYVAGVPVQKYKDFNPNSRQQIEWLLKVHYGYTPDNEELYEDERLKIDDITFRFIKSDPAASDEVRSMAGLLEEYLMLNKRLGQLADGRYAWLKMVWPDGKIHGSVNPCGAVTGRATHANPNVAQVPRVGTPYGKECRSLFKVPDGWVQAGIDACGLELRCLAHFMYPYDHGAYAHEVVHGDIHTANQIAAGLPERNQAKTFIYAFLYGAGDEKIGKIVGGDAADGKRLKKKFLAQTPALAQLRAAIENTLVEKRGLHGQITKWRRRYLKGLDGRPLHVRSIHSALNTLLQSAGALICKLWIIRAEERLIALGLDHGKDFQFMAWIHDEFQCACRTQEIAEIVVREAQNAMRDAQEIFHFRVQLDTEGKIGGNWCDCH
ncbi:MAG: DNA polymerase [Phascolarctobacterium sp.]|nr:MAG: DNA polymerase [Phascolarctobacterium sp.]